MTLIEANGLYKVFGRGASKAIGRLKAGATRDELRDEGITAAVIDASFSVDPGQIFVVMGLSGSGKSTLIRMVNGLLVPTEGTLKIAGSDIASMKPAELRQVRREKISMVFQHFALFPHYTVGQNAAYGLEVQGVNKAEREERAERALGLVGLGGWGAMYPSQLSGGMQQRVGLARALAAETEIMLMDEAFSALDPLIRREMQDQLIELQSELGKTIVFITHDLNEAMRLGDQIAMMRDGRIEQIGSSEQILNDPANDYVAQFIQDVDRTRVLTASAVMEKPVAVLGSGQGPRTAHKLMRQHQIHALVVVDRTRTFQGIVLESDVADAVRKGQETLEGLLHTDVPTASEDTVVADLLTDAAQAAGVLPVLDERNKLKGVIARVTLLNALGGSWSESDPSANEPIEVAGV